MPIYQYKCTDCGHQLEALQKMSDAQLRDCPQCKLPGLRKQITAAAFKLKGTGWYETDFKNSGKKPAADNTSSGTAKKSNATASPKNTSATDSTAKESTA